jgi:hypothetical protein
VPILTLGEGPVHVLVELCPDEAPLAGSADTGTLAGDA